MGSKYIDLVNNVLRKMNEVELTTETWSGSYGVQNAAKDAVRDAINKITNQEFRWPFNNFEHTMNLSIGQLEYPWPENYEAVDWNSFMIKADQTLNNKDQKLTFINTDQWMLQLRDHTYNPDGQRMPQFVFPSTGMGFGVGPSADKPYILTFRYFITPPELVNPDDRTTIPHHYDYVINSAAMWWMYLWRDNDERAAASEAEYGRNIKHMTSVLINLSDYVYDGRISNRRAAYNAYGGSLI